MKITSRLVVPPQFAAKARSRWRELGGAESSVRGDDRIQVTFTTQDDESPDGKLLPTLAKELGATPDGPVSWSQGVVYDAADIASAELLRLDVGSLHDVVDPKTLTSGDDCPECGLPRHQQPIEEGRVRLTGSQVAKFDFFSGELLLFARGALPDLLRPFRGATLVEVDAPRDAGEVYGFTGASSLGYPSDAKWGPPCKACGRRRGTPGDSYITGKHTYPRAAWDGSDVVVSGLYPSGAFVTQAVWKIVSNEKWRVPERGVHARPVHLVDDAEPEGSR